MKFYSFIVAAVVICLNSLAQDQEERQAHPHFHVKPDASTSPVGYVPLQIRHAYGLDLLTNGGAGQVIAIVDAYGSPTRRMI